MQLDQVQLPWPDYLRLLAHEVRWNILVLLARSDYRGRELMKKLQHSQNLLSYHLRLLTEGHLVTERRSTADARDIYYSLNIERLRTNYFAAASALHPALDVSTYLTQKALPSEKGSPVRVLFLCTHNSARSQMAEGFLRQMSQGHIEVYSAGTEPTEVHPLAKHVMANKQIDLCHHRSKRLQDLGKLTFTYIVTVCDRVREVCPTVSAPTEHIHWSIPDPAEEGYSEQEQQVLFEEIADQIMNRVRTFQALIEQDQQYRAINDV